MKVIQNADGTLTLSALSNGNSTYIFVLEPNPYADVSEDDWYYDAAMTMDQWLLMQGTTTTTFGGGANVTRQQMWMILARLSGAAPANMTEAREWAMAEGVSDGTDPGGAVSRQQFAAMLYRYAAASGMDVGAGEDTNILSYNDAFSLAEYAFAPMQWACGEGIVTGNNGYLLPEQTATRAQVAVMLTRFLASAER